MKTIDLESRSDSKRMLHLDIPVDDADRDYRVTVVIDSINGKTATEIDSWPDGFFEATCGQWQGDFVIDSEGELETRSQL